MDSWNQENGSNNNNNGDVTVSGQFYTDSAQSGGNGQNAYGQPGNNTAQNTYGQSQNSFNGSYNSNNYGQGNYGVPNVPSTSQSQNTAGGYNQPYVNYNQQQYPGMGLPPIEKEEPVEMGEWIGLLALATFVPCIGIILVIVWAFNKTEKKSKSNFCKAYLIIWLIKLAIAMTLFIIFGMSMVAEIGSL